MSHKGLALGFTIGLGIAASLIVMYTPRTGEELRDTVKKAVSDCFFKLRWQLMSPEERYVYFWARSRHRRQKEQQATLTE